MAKKKVEGNEVALRQFQFVVPTLTDPLVAEVDRYEGVVAIEIEDGEGYQVIGQELVGIKVLAKRLADRKEELLGPIKEQLIKPIEAWLKPMAKTLEKAEDTRKAAISAYKKSEDEMLATIRELEGKQGQPLVLNEASLEVVGGRIGTSDKTTFVVEDISLVPLDLITAAVTETKRGKEALDEVIRGRISGGIRKIPGVRIEKDYQVSVTLV